MLLGWIFFRAASFSDAIGFIGGVFGGASVATTVTPLIVALIVIGMALHALPPRAIQHVAMRVRTMPAVLVGLGVGVLVLIIDSMRPEGVAPFIYYQF